MPVLLKGEMMKKLLTYCSLLGIALSGYQPAFAKDLVFDGGIKVNVPEYRGPVDNHKMDLLVTSEKVEGKKIIYTWKLTNRIDSPFNDDIEKAGKGDYCNNTQPNGAYHWEIKFYPKVEIVNQPYLARYFDISLTADGQKIWGSNAHQRIRVDIGKTVTFRLELTLKKEALYNGGGDYTIRKGQPLAVVSIFCENGGRNNNEWINQSQMYNKFTGIEMKAADDATLHFSRTCIISGNRDLEVNLFPVTKAELEDKGRIKGGQFDLLLNCSQAGIKNAYIMFTDQLDPSNKTTLLTTQNGNTKRNDVKFIIQDSEGKAVKYGPAPTSSIVLQGEQVDYPNMQLFGKRLSNEPFLKKSYTVFYQKSVPTGIEPGEVQGKVIYNLYYN